MVAQECSPSLRWRPSAPDHVLGDRRLGDLKPELEQFTVDAWGAPQWVLAGRSARSQHPFHENEKYKFFYSLAIYRRRAPPPGWWGGSQYLRSPKLRFALFRRHSLEADARVTLIIECGLDAFVVTAWMTMPDPA